MLDFGLSKKCNLRTLRKNCSLEEVEFMLPDHCGCDCKSQSFENLLQFKHFNVEEVLWQNQDLDEYILSQLNARYKSFSRNFGINKSYLESTVDREPIEVVVQQICQIKDPHDQEDDDSESVNSQDSVDGFCTMMTLKEICVAANLPYVRQMNTHALWSHCFRLNKVTSSIDQRRRFGYSITSANVGGPASVLRSAYRAPPASRYGFAFDGTGYQPLDVNYETHVIGIDVNRGVLLAASCGPDDRIPDVPTEQSPFANGKQELVYTTARWREENGENLGEKKLAEWNERAPEIVNAMAHIPSAKSTSFLGIIQHLQYVLQHRDSFTGFHRPEMWRKLRRKLISKRQRAYDNLVRMLTLRQDGQFDHNTIIAYGAGNFVTASPGYPATPDKRLFYELKKRSGVCLVHEFQTSQKCSNCECELGQSRVWRIKHCANNNCLAIWHRVVNAARNIHYIFLARNRDGGERPVPFRYDPPRPQQ